MRLRAFTLVSLSTIATAVLGSVLALTGGAGSPAHAAPPQAGAAHLAYSGELTQGGWIRGTVPEGTKSLSLDGQPVAIAPDGAWFAAFDRDAGRTARLAMTAADGGVTTQPITIAPRAWKIENINIPRKPGGPTEAFMELRRPELARIQAARALQTEAQGWREHFIWPVKGRISGRFGSQRIYRGEPGSYHSGIDITSGASGTPFVAPADGVVILAADKPFTLEGNLLMLDHGMGLNSAFLHCSQILVKEGDHVKQGQVIGRIGMTGRATGPHLHWSIKWENARLDPLLFTGPMN
ncbi:M23 family metallopeptidase [Novosphingobium album (ex Hu et al. 2023)]|uniref:M23 family metallopeptidase n=1 Tax=Novosphingobium album (ex Hu et al. 2023) TaxID=2930093 RepID=A0ABT0B4Y0_9SPHN|nr:M23 family metallopeptidase [Novosphingobium album (ex Hu et al. 2023)]MCJ2179949.1 M23 family metallopeptidase [Novosphingobium album (ex Hu et al. 2023)]